MDEAVPQCNCFHDTTVAATRAILCDQTTQNLLQVPLPLLFWMFVSDCVELATGYKTSTSIRTALTLVRTRQFYSHFPGKHFPIFSCPWSWSKTIAWLDTFPNVNHDSHSLTSGEGASIHICQLLMMYSHWSDKHFQPYFIWYFLRGGLQRFPTFLPHASFSSRHSVVPLSETVSLKIYQSHCESSPGSFDEYRLSAGWPPTLRPSQLTWAVSPPINGCYRPHLPLSFVIIT